MFVVKVGNTIIKTVDLLDTKEFSVDIDFSNCNVGEEIYVAIKYKGKQEKNLHIWDQEKMISRLQSRT